MQRNSTYTYAEAPVAKRSGNFIRRVSPVSGGFHDTAGIQADVRPGDILMVLGSGTLAQFRDVEDEQPSAPAAESEPEPGSGEEPEPAGEPQPTGT